MNRKLILEAALSRTRPIADIRAELAQFPWDSEPLVLLSRVHVRKVLDAYLSGEIDAYAVEDWAELAEVRDDIEFENEEVHEIVFFLANLTINGPLTPELARQIQVELSNLKGG